jgi:hypothetical protein
MRGRGRVVLLVVASLVVVLVSVVAFVVARNQFVRESTEEPTAGADRAAVLAGPHVTFRNAARDSNYGALAAVSLDNPAGPRAYFDVLCERQYSNRNGGVCLNSDRGVVTTYAILELDPNLQQVRDTPLTGTPSRTRLSADATTLATTTFVTGHSYADTAFSTETIIRRDGESLGNLEEWTAIVDGRPMLAASRNFWGVTFADDGDTFYATGAITPTTWLMKGSISERTLTSLRTDAECPSLSPDGTKLGYKKRLGNQTPGAWRFAVLDLKTNEETILAETRDVDDQLEWLDDNHVLYQMPRSGNDATVTDIWVVPADGTGEPEVFIPEASSPAVVR